MMTTLTRITTFLCVLLPLLFIGCGANTGTNSGVGADGGPWPNKNTNSRNANGMPEANEQPKAALLVFLSAKAAEGEALTLDVSSIELKYESNWYTVATKDGKNNTAKLLLGKPLRVDEKGNLALIANAMVPRRKYTGVQIKLSDDRTVLFLKGSETGLPVTLEKTFISMGEFVLDIAARNTVTININGAVAEKHEKTAVIQDTAITASKGTATGSISGTISPPVANTKIEVFWGDTDIAMGQAIAQAQNGTFKIEKLPSGKYTVKVTANGHHLVDPFTKPVTVADKDLSLSTIQLAEDPRP